MAFVILAFLLCDFPGVASQACYLLANQICLGPCFQVYVLRVTKDSDWAIKTAQNIRDLSTLLLRGFRNCTVSCYSRSVRTEVMGPGVSMAAAADNAWRKLVQIAVDAHATGDEALFQPAFAPGRVLEQLQRCGPKGLVLSPAETYPAWEKHWVEYAGSKGIHLSMKSLPIKRKVSKRTQVSL